MAAFVNHQRGSALGGIVQYGITGNHHRQATDYWQTPPAPAANLAPPAKDQGQNHQHTRYASGYGVGTPQANGQHYHCQHPLSLMLQSYWCQYGHEGHAQPDQQGSDQHSPSPSSHTLGSTCCLSPV